VKRARPDEAPKPGAFRTGAGDESKPATEAKPEPADDTTTEAQNAEVQSAEPAEGGDKK
jgi:hypothetical protein